MRALAFLPLSTLNIVSLFIKLIDQDEKTREDVKAGID